MGLFIDSKLQSDLLKQSLKKIKREIWIYTDSFGTALAIKKFTSKYSKYSFSCKFLEK